MDKKDILKKLKKELSHLGEDHIDLLMVYFYIDQITKARFIDGIPNTLMSSGRKIAEKIKELGWKIGRQKMEDLIGGMIVDESKANQMLFFVLIAEEYGVDHIQEYLDTALNKDKNHGKAPTS